MPQSWWGMYPAAKYWPIYADPTQAWPWMVLRGPPANGIPTPIGLGQSIQVHLPRHIRP